MALLTSLLLGVGIGMVGVASNPSPQFGALGLLVVSVFGCLALAAMGGTFLSMIVILIYSGGMLVVFAYSAALAAVPFPEGWGDWSVGGRCLFYIFVVLCVAAVIPVEWLEGNRSEFAGGWGLGASRSDVEGMSWMYGVLGIVVMLAAGALLLTLFVVLEVVRGLSRGTVRAI